MPFLWQQTGRSREFRAPAAGGPSTRTQKQKIPLCVFSGLVYRRQTRKENKKMNGNRLTQNKRQTKGRSVPKKKETKK